MCWENTSTSESNYSNQWGEMLVTHKELLKGVQSISICDFYSSQLLSACALPGITGRNGTIELGVILIADALCFANRRTEEHRQDSTSNNYVSLNWQENWIPLCWRVPTFVDQKSKTTRPFACHQMLARAWENSFSGGNMRKCDLWSIVC